MLFTEEQISQEMEEIKASYIRAKSATNKLTTLLTGVLAATGQASIPFFDRSRSAATRVLDGLNVDLGENVFRLQAIHNLKKRKIEEHNAAIEAKRQEKKARKQNSKTTKV